MCLEFADDFPMETHLGGGAYGRLCAVPLGKSGALLHAGQNRKSSIRTACTTL